MEIEVPPQKGVSTEPPKTAEKKSEPEESPIKQTVTLKVISAIAHGFKSAWSKIVGFF